MAAPLNQPDGATSREGARTAARRVGQRSGVPSATQAAARVATNTASEPFTGHPSVRVEPDGDLGHVAGGQDPERTDGQVDRLAGAVDGDALAPHQPERLVHRPECVGAQRHRAQRPRRPTRRPRRGPAAPSVEADLDAGPARRRARATCAPRPGARRGGRAPRATARAASTSAQPAPRELGRHRRPGNVDHLDVHPGAQRRHPRQRRAPGRPSPPCDRRGPRPVPSGRSARASGGRFGPAPHDVLAAPQDPHGLTAPRRPARGRCAGTGLRALPPKAPPLASGEAGRAAGPAPTGVGLDVGGLHPGRLQRERPLARRAARRGATGAPCCCVPGRGRRPPWRRGGSRATARVGTQLDQRAGRRGVVGEASAAEHDVGPRDLERRALDLGPPGQASSGSRGAGAGVSRAPSPTPERVARRLDDRTASRCSGTGGPAAPPRRRVGSACRPAPAPSSAASRITMPGVQKPHWLAPCATKAAAQRSRCSVGSPSTRGHPAAGDAAHRGHAGDAGRAVDPDRAAPALALGTAAVLDRTAAQLLAQRVEEGGPVVPPRRAPR